MRIVPAVDIRDGLCVNLVQGDYARETVFSDDPVAQARQWYAAGASLVHIVDLDGAQAGRICVEKALRAIADTGARFEIGGGVRCMDSVRLAFDAGAERVILGTAAHEAPALVREAAEAFPGRIVAGIDARAGKVAVRGWKETTDTDAAAFARTMEAAGAARIIYTDVLKDGMMAGPNIEATGVVAASVSIPVTASGGVSSLGDIGRLRSIEADGVDEIIIGRALYMGAFTLQAAISAAIGSA